MQVLPFYNCYELFTLNCRVFVDAAAASGGAQSNVKGTLDVPVGPSPVRGRRRGVEDAGSFSEPFCAECWLQQT